jgi:hypothetical protein
MNIVPTFDASTKSFLQRAAFKPGASIPTNPNERPMKAARRAIACEKLARVHAA